MFNFEKLPDTPIAVERGSLALIRTDAQSFPSCLSVGAVLTVTKTRVNYKTTDQRSVQWCSPNRVLMVFATPDAADAVNSQLKAAERDYLAAQRLLVDNTKTMFDSIFAEALSQ